MAIPALIIGVGNPLFGDDGFGIELIRQLRAAWPPPEDVEILDGGTAGIYLLPELEDRDRVILVDAVNFGGAPGEIVRLRNGEIPSGIGLKLSEHQVTVKEVIALLELLGHKPRDILVIGVQPRQLRFAEPLSEEVASAIPVVIDEIRAEVAAWPPQKEAHRAFDECAVCVE